MYVHTPPLRAEYDTKLIIKKNKPGLHSKLKIIYIILQFNADITIEFCMPMCYSVKTAHRSKTFVTKLCYYVLIFKNAFLIQFVT